MKKRKWKDKARVSGFTSHHYWVGSKNVCVCVCVCVFCFFMPFLSGLGERERGVGGWESFLFYGKIGIDLGY